MEETASSTLELGAEPPNTRVHWIIALAFCFKLNCHGLKVLLRLWLFLNVLNTKYVTYGAN